MAQANLQSPQIAYSDPPQSCPTQGYPFQSLLDARHLRGLARNQIVVNKQFSQFGFSVLRGLGYCNPKSICI